MKFKYDLGATVLILIVLLVPICLLASIGGVGGVLGIVVLLGAIFFSASKSAKTEYVLHKDRLVINDSEDEVEIMLEDIDYIHLTERYHPKGWIIREYFIVVGEIRIPISKFHGNEERQNLIKYFEENDSVKFVRDELEYSFQEKESRECRRVSSLYDQYKS